MTLTTKEAWALRKERYGPTGAKKPDLYREHCSTAHKGHPANKGFSNHRMVDGKCIECGGIHHTGNYETGSSRAHFKHCTWGRICQKHGVVHGPPPMQGKHHSEDSKTKSSESNKAAHNTPEMLAKKSEDAKRQWQSPARLARRLASFQEHEKAVQEEAEKLRASGYIVLPLDKRLRPDMIAKKDGKIYAVEVDFDGNTRKGKYDGVTFFDEIIWRYRHREPLYKANCQTCGKEFGYDIKSSNQKFCCTACYGRSLEGKVPIAAMRARGLA